MQFISVGQNVAVLQIVKKTRGREEGERHTNTHGLKLPIFAAQSKSNWQLQSQLRFKVDDGPSKQHLWPNPNPCHDRWGGTCHVRRRRSERRNRWGTARYIAGSPFVCEEEGGGVGDRHVPGILPNLYYHTLSYEQCPEFKFRFIFFRLQMSCFSALCGPNEQKFGEPLT